MKCKKLLAVMLILAMTVTMLTACGKKTDTTKDNNTAVTGTPAGPTEVPVDNSNMASDNRSLYMGTPDANAITVNLASEPADLCSITTTDTLSGSILRHVIENLVELDENDNVVPGVATDWTVSDDGLTYTFHLRQGMKWSNGEPVTAHDFVFAWTALLDPAYAAEYAGFGYVFKNGRAFNEGKVTADQLGFKALDDYTLEVTLENPTAYFLSTLAFYVLSPVNEKAYKEFGTAYATDADKIVTNGPFKLTSWEHESKIVMDKNPDFYDAANINVDKITWLMINDTNAALNSFKAGEVDIIGVNGDQAKMLKTENFPVYTYDDGSCFYLEYNLKDKYLANNDLRKALTYAIDKQAFVDSIVKNSSKPALGFTPPALKGLNKSFVDEVGPQVPVVDVAQAKELYQKALSELGVDKVELTMICDDGDTAIKNAAFIQEQLKTNLGIDLKVEPMPFKSRIERMQNEDFSIIFAGWGPDYNDPQTFLDVFETGNGNNHTSYSDADYDALLNKVRTTVDPAERMGYLYDMEKKLMSDLPIGPVYWRARDYVVSGKIASGVVRTAFQDMNYRYVKLAQ